MGILDIGDLISREIKSSRVSFPFLGIPSESQQTLKGDSTDQALGALPTDQLAHPTKTKGRLRVGHIASRLALYTLILSHIRMPPI